ncbi:MAG: hypothetical protein A2X13_07210 [Bacteroidetes bacterium GWC2_33_15]|nr:MAG: hypothetical protein A2X10_11495 [Bacteroidetes bacterium GWA2_33_15]OFX51263.1 MAG: hypothetical protein A2X13_07210 [Bacteroidetes bacterium GWC2_33_15]OFX66373.1 MAG: hypothetical protein A2X15_00265 [Bacteroidetes bacterium GWB2_32_14]OFX70666.1 MAG: hypothetical protein A2X14_10950 [Bacteroidetes bacterium GWD2_33_33]HAN20048.1 hypothetical protein [Bacteroidales bacterium]
MKKVLLINSNLENIPYPVAPLGLALLASSLQNKYEVKVFDFAFNSTESLVQFIKDFNPDYIGIGLRNIDNVTMRRTKWYIDDIREKIVKPIQENFTIPIILGGSGFSIAPKELLDFFSIEYGVVGEGEKTFAELLEVLEQNKNPEIINNVLTRKGGVKKFTFPDEGLLILPKANVDLFIDFLPYLQRSSYPVQTKRGCAFNCIYCSYPRIEGKKYRLRPVTDIVDEIQNVNLRFPGVTFEIVDSTFNSPLKHAIAICDEIIKRELRIKIRTMGVNPGLVTGELIQKMKLAGFSQIDCTPETASDMLLKKLNKNFNKNKLVECAKIIKNQDMPTMWFFMFGLPGETEETINETFDFIDRHIPKHDMVHVTEGIRIIPQTELYDIALNEGVISGNENVIDPMFYVSPTIGKAKLTGILASKVDERNNVVNSIDSAPSPELLKQAIQFRQENNIDEPMFRTLLKLTK